MKEKVVELIGKSLEDLGITIDDVILEKEGKNQYLRVVLDSLEIIDMDKVVAATKIIDPILEKADLVKDAYILDVYAKSKGEE